MSEYMFGAGQGFLPERANEIAQEHGAYLVNHEGERGEERHWFCGPNRGEAFDRDLESTVLGALSAAGVGATKLCPVCEASECSHVDCPEDCYPMSDCDACSHTGRVPLDFDPNA